MVSEASRLEMVRPLKPTRSNATKGDDPDAPVFTGPLSEGLRRATLYKAWSQAVRRSGYEGIHLHDLRHAAGTLATQQGATVREVMARLGHASPGGRTATSTPLTVETP